MNQQTTRWLAGIALVAAGIWILQGLLISLAWAGVIAVATWPLYENFRKVFSDRWNRLWPASLFSLLLAVVFIVPLVTAVIQLGNEGKTIGAMIADAQVHGIPPPAWLTNLPESALLKEQWQAYLGSPQAATDTIKELGSGPAFFWTKHITAHVMHSMVVMAFTWLTLFFIYLHGDALSEKLLTLCTNLFGEQGKTYLLHAMVAVRATVNGLVVVGLGEGVLLGIAYSLCGLPRPTLLGAFTGILAMIPFAAPIVFGAAAIVLIAQGSVVSGLSLAIFGFLVLFIADHLVRPIVIGNAAKLPFLWVLLGIFGGLETMRLIGLFLGPTLMALLVALWREWTRNQASART